MFTRYDGSISDFSPKRHIDLSHVFTFPLTPVPLSLCYCDGTMAKTEKTALFLHLESKVMRSGWKLPAASILPPNLPATYGRLAATILIQATTLSSKRVDIIFDTYEMPSIKRMERERDEFAVVSSIIYDLVVNI